jgi:hypothetical protein
MSDSQIEQEIQAKGLSAPRVTPAAIEAEINSEHYFTAAQGYQRVMEERVFNQAGVTDGAGAAPPQALEQLTFCVLLLRNGFTVTGESACASPENFDPEMGRKIARQNAVNKVWPLLGFRLRDRLALSAVTGMASDGGRLG